MASGLRSTTLGPSTSNKVSPKIHAINLLIAEFLLQHEYHHTLSVFTSEVPLLRTIKEFTLSGTQISNGSEKAPRFRHRDVKDILESFGLPVESDIGNRIYNQYQESVERIALLTCIFQNVSGIKMCKSGSNKNEAPVKDSNSKSSIKDAATSEKESQALKKLYKKEMQEIIYQSQLKSQHIKQLQEDMRRCVWIVYSAYYILN
jgi:hypothetical protein